MGTECLLEWTDEDKLHCTVCGRIIVPTVPRSDGLPLTSYRYQCGPRTRPTMASRGSSPRPPAAHHATGTGVGDHVHRLVKRLFGEDYRPGCGCENAVNEMNRLGPAGCRMPENAKRFADVLVKQAEKRKWKTAKLSTISSLIGKAAATPGLKTITRAAAHQFCKRLVLVACKLAERSAVSAGSEPRAEAAGGEHDAADAAPEKAPQG